MSQTDIYKNREQVQTAPTAPHTRKGRRRRSASRDPFDETGNRRRRSNNSGLRRLLHLFRKGGNEKKFWWGLLIVTVVVLAFIAIWQFWYLEHIALKQSRENEMYVPIQDQSWTDSAAE